MTREEAIRNINALNAVCGQKDFYDKEFQEALRMAIVALTESNGELISRDTAMMIVMGANNSTDAIRQIQDLPSAPIRPQKGEWIPVSERLPEKGVEVLACDIDGDILKGWMQDRTHLSNAEGYYKNIVAWQPLPTPYKADKE